MPYQKFVMKELEILARSKWPPRAFFRDLSPVNFVLESLGCYKKEK